MKLVYVVSKHTTENSNYKLHIPDVKTGQPWCGSHQRSHTIEFVEGFAPTCKRCLREYEGPWYNPRLPAQRGLRPFWEFPNRET